MKEGPGISGKKNAQAAGFNEEISFLVFPRRFTVHVACSPKNIVVSGGERDWLGLGGKVGSLEKTRLDVCQQNGTICDQLLCEVWCFCRAIFDEPN